MLSRLCLIEMIGTNVSIVPVRDRSAPVLCGRLAADAKGTLVAMNGACKVDSRSFLLFMHVDINDVCLQSSLPSEAELKHDNSSHDGAILASDDVVVLKVSTVLQHDATKRSTAIIMSTRKRIRAMMDSRRDDDQPQFSVVS